MYLLLKHAHIPVAVLGLQLNTYNLAMGVCLIIVLIWLLKWRTMSDGNNPRPIHYAYF